MRHLKAGRKLGRTASHRRAMLRNMVTSLFREERVHTTEAKAKEARRMAERLITRARGGTLHDRRLAARYIQDSEVLRKLFADLAPRFAERPGGYTRIYKTGFRDGDGGRTAMLELLGAPAVRDREKKEASKGRKARSRAEERAAAEASSAEAAAEAQAEKSGKGGKAEKAEKTAKQGKTAKTKKKTVEPAERKAEGKARSEKAEAADGLKGGKSARRGLFGRGKSGGKKGE